MREWIIVLETLGAYSTVKHKQTWEIKLCGTAPDKAYVFGNPPKETIDLLNARLNIKGGIVVYP